MKIFNIIFCVIFLISAGLQYNDPDPYLWVPIYMYGVIYCWLAFKGRYHPKAYLIGSAVLLVYAVYEFFSTDGVLDWMNKHNAEDIAGTMKAEKPWIESTREFFGLLMLIGVMMINYVVSRRKIRKA
jgi:hypothetical protein